MPSDKKIPVPDHTIHFMEYLADDDPECNNCQHPWALHGHDDGSCTVGAAWYDGRGADPDPNACQCRDFKNVAYEDWYCSYCKGLKDADECLASRS